MGRRNQLNKFQVLNSIDTTTDPESEPTDVSSLDKILYQIEIGSSVDGSISVLVCNDRVLTSSSQFVELDFNTQLDLIGATDTEYMINIENSGFKWMKLSFTDNSGSGNISAWISGTQVGG